MRNFALTLAPRKLGVAWLLIDKDGEEYSPFSICMKNLSRRGFSRNTIDTYAGHIARFIDYMVEACQLTNQVTEEYITDVVFSYEQYLLFGQESDDPIAYDMSCRIPKQRNTNPASLIIFLAVRSGTVLLVPERTLDRALSCAFRTTR